MRVVTPPITDYKNVGYYISRECNGVPTYMLEKVVTSGEQQIWGGGDEASALKFESKCVQRIYSQGSSYFTVSFCHVGKLKEIWQKI